jgi:DNA-binding transcriptional MerR regulator
MEEYTIGQFSKLLGVNKDTILYYENLGLFPLPKRKENGYKIYTKQHVEVMEVILLLFKERIVILKIIYIRIYYWKK